MKLEQIPIPKEVHENTLKCLEVIESIVRELKVVSSPEKIEILKLALEAVTKTLALYGTNQLVIKNDKPVKIF